MAIPVSAITPQTQGIFSLRNTLTEINKSTSTTQKSISNISKLLSNGTRQKSFIAKKSKIFKLRSEEVKKRNVKEAEIEASSINFRSVIPGSKVLKTSGGSFLERILKFLGWTTLGWLINNLPEWIDKGERFINRIRVVGNILNNAPNKIFNIMKEFGNILNGVFQNTMNFDFLDKSGEISTATDELTESFNSLKNDITDAFAVLSGLDDDDDDDDDGEDTTEEIPSTEGGGTTSYTSTGGEKLEDVGGVDYGQYSPGGRGSRGSSRVHGVKGQKGHTGEDYALPEGTPITMVANGTVVDVGLMGDSNDPDGQNGGYGNFVVIQLEDGTFVKLAHMESINVRKGEEVGAGTGNDGNAKVVGRSGSTGLSTGPHLHVDHAKKYDFGSSQVSETMNPAGLINDKLIVKGGNVKATKTTTPSTNNPNPVSQILDNVREKLTLGSSIAGDMYNDARNWVEEQVGGVEPQTSFMPSGKNFDIASLIKLSKSVGFDDEQSIKMAAIAMAESGGDSSKDTIKSGLYNQNGETSYGLWQINMTGPLEDERLRLFGIDSVNDLYDPMTNAKAAKTIFDLQNYQAWTVYGGREYNMYLNDARSVAPTLKSSTTGNETNKVASVTEERVGDTIILNTSNSQPQLPQSLSNIASKTTSNSPNKITMLNSFIKQKILLELSYV